MDFIWESDESGAMACTCDGTSKQQHGFMKNKSTATGGLLLQSLIARAMDNDCYIALAGIDLSAAFDVVDVELLIKRLDMYIISRGG